MNHTRHTIIIWLLLCALVLTAGCGTRRAPSETVHTWGYVPEQMDQETGTIIKGWIPGTKLEAGASAGLLQAMDEPEIIPVLSPEAIREAMDAYGIEEGSTAARALAAINDTYAPRLSKRQREACMVFFFEGAGSDPDPSWRWNAMCLVVWDGRIIYLDRNSTTIPDYPFVPWKNENRDTPTLKSGIYAFDTVNHNGAYGALRVLNDKVVRFHNASEFYEDVSNHESIQVHRRVTNKVSPADEAWGNSVGCLLVSDSSTDPNGGYAGFLKALGVISGGSSGNSRYQSQVKGTVIVDRTFGFDYLRAVGYPDEALALIEPGGEA